LKKRRRRTVNTRPRFSIKLHRSTVIAIVVAALAAVAVTGTVLAAGGPSPQKQAALAKVATAEAKAAAGPHAPKPPDAGKGLPPSSSCPNPVHTGIFPFNDPPWHIDARFTNDAQVVSGAGDPYLIYAGALQSDPQQGLLLVMREDNDPCAVVVGRVPARGYTRSYLSPTRGGALTLTQIVSDRVAFSVADGSHGSFNYVTEQYLSS
jgi:hypothetical protein